MAKVCTPMPGLPLNLFDRARELYRDIRWKRGYWTFWWEIRHFWWRRRQSKQMRLLMTALSTGSYSNVMVVKLNPGTPLQVESLAPVMTVVTFDERMVRLER